MTLYATTYNDIRPVRQNAHGVWWCPYCDRSHAAVIRACTGCHATVEEGPTPPFFATPVPYEVPSTAAPAVARLHSDLRADIDTAVAEDEPTVQMAHKQRPQDRPRRKPGIPGRPPKGGRR